MSSEKLVNAWRSLINDDNKSWVIFEGGTCVILVEPKEDLAAQAIELMKKYGPVHAGSSAGDFSTIGVNSKGWVVTCHHSDIMTYVGVDELGGTPAVDIFIGLHGRSKRDADANSLKVIHVEDKRAS